MKTLSKAITKLLARPQRITRQSKMCERLLRGLWSGEAKKPGTQPRALKLTRVGRDLFAVHITNAKKEELVLVIEAELQVGDSCTIMDLHRAFDITLSAG